MDWNCFFRVDLEVRCITNILASRFSLHVIVADKPELNHNSWSKCRPHQHQYSLARQETPKFKDHLFDEWRSSTKEALALICPVRFNMKRRSRLLVPIDLSSGNLRRMFPNRLGSLGWKLLLYSNNDACTLSCSLSTSCWSSRPFTSEHGQNQNEHN